MSVYKEKKKKDLEYLDKEEKSKKPESINDFKYIELLRYGHSVTCGCGRGGDGCAADGEGGAFNGARWRFNHGDESSTLVLSNIIFHSRWQVVVVCTEVVVSFL